MHKSEVVLLRVTHRAAHAGKAFAKAQIIRGRRFRRLALRPVPTAPVLKIHDEDGVAGDWRPLLLQANIVNAAHTLLEHLRRHDRGANGEHHTTVEAIHTRAEARKVPARTTTDGRTVEHRMAA